MRKCRDKASKLPASHCRGFDSRLDNTWFFDAAVRSYPPIALKPGDALVSSISLAQSHSVPEVMRALDMSISPVRTISVLKVVSAAPSGDAFRPSYCDRSQTIYHANALQRNLLLSVAPPNPSGTPTLAQFEALYRRPWIDTDDSLFDTPAEYMPNYGMHVALADSYASLLLMLKFPPAPKNQSHELLRAIRHRLVWLHAGRHILAGVRWAPQRPKASHPFRGHAAE